MVRKRSVLERSEILGLFVNILFVNKKYSGYKRRESHASNLNANISKMKNFLFSFLCISQIYIKFKRISKKNLSLIPESISEIINSQKQNYLNV